MLSTVEVRLGGPVVPDVTGLSALGAALAYCDAGFWLVPTHPTDIKNPGSVLGRAWQRRSSCDPDQMQRWFGNGSAYGIALHTGPSGVIAFDLDHPANIPAELTRAIATSNPPHQSTRTGTRGRGHYLFAVPPDAPPGSSAGGLGPDWGDVRSGNTVIVLAPTPHPKPDGQYRWVSTGPIPPLPDNLAAKLGQVATRADLASAETLADELIDNVDDPDEQLRAILDPYLDAINSGVCRHDTMRGAQLALVDAANQGARGLGAALDQLRDAFESQIGDDPSRAGEFDRTLSGAFCIKAAEVAGGAFDIPAEINTPVPDKAIDPPGAPERPTVLVDGNILTTIQTIHGHLIQRWNGRVLFNYGGAIAELSGHQVHALSHGEFPLRLARTIRTMKRVRNERVDAWPDPNVMASVKALAPEYAALDRVSRVPFLRTDGTVCAEPGYDPVSRAVLVLDPGTVWPQIPRTPTSQQVTAARDLLLDDWLGDLPFETQADRANALGTVLTPLIRGTVPLSPLAVVDGTQMGVGKNLFADCLALLVTGAPAMPMPYTRDDDETRKAITSAFRSGADLFVFDEAHTLSGAALARALTSLTYTDRLLGETRMLEFPNRVSWLALGNNVSVIGDLIRRVYRVRLAPTDPNPEIRRNDTFRHPDLRGWTTDHRAGLVGACLTLIRAWYAAGCPCTTGPPSMGSFELWERCVGGILSHAGVPGFLDNTKEWKQQADYQAQYWEAHLAWLHHTFKGETFSSSQVRNALMDRIDPAFGGLDEVTPPHMFDPTDKDYSFKLGRAYATIVGRNLGGYRIVRPPSTSPSGISRSGGTARWLVIENGEDQ